MSGILHRSMYLVRRSMGALLRGARRPVAAIQWAHRQKVSRQSGFALLVVMTTVAILGAVVGEFGYNARVELEAAANARDTLRAEYLARSGINLSRLLIKVQQAVIDPFNKQLQSDFQIIDFAPYLLAAFGGGDDERASMGALLGFDSSSIQGLGVGKGGSFDVVLGTEDGKININCGGGYPTGTAPILSNSALNTVNNNSGGSRAPMAGVTTSPSLNLYNLLIAVMFPPRYNRLFDNENPDGQFYTRDDIARGIIDWSDIDEAKYDPTGLASSGANEDYRYDTLRDPYKAHNNYFDTAEEVNLVRGVTDDMWGSFGSMLTVYGPCKINVRAVSQEHWPITAAIIRASAQNPAENPVLQDDTIVAALAQQLASLMQLPGQLMNISSIATSLSAGAQLPVAAGASAGAGGAQSQTPLQFPGLPGVQLDQTKLNAIARVGRRYVYRMESTGSIKRAGTKKIQVRIRAIYDSTTINQNVVSQDPNDFRGTWVYWRME